MRAHRVADFEVCVLFSVARIVCPAVGFALRTARPQDPLSQHPDWIVRPGMVCDLLVYAPLRGAGHRNSFWVIDSSGPPRPAFRAQRAARWHWYYEGMRFIRAHIVPIQ